MAEPLVSHISDTARWVAVYRAMESERPDALFKDPFAARLAGDRGREIAKSISNPRMNAWPMVVRTKVIDDLVLTSIAGGTDRVINLAAGLDTRPYRLKLPQGLTWIEADLPAMVEEKTRLLAAEKPVCHLIREKVDLSDARARSAFLDRALSDARQALVLTEGLLVYLPEQTVRALAADLHARAQIRWWMVDLASPGVLRMMDRRTRNKMSDDARFIFGPANGVAFFAPLGWKSRDVVPIFHEAGRLKRLPLFLRPFTLFKTPSPESPGNRPWSAVVRFEHA